MKAKIPLGGSNVFSMLRMAVEIRKNNRSSNEHKLRTEDITVFPPLRLDHVVDRKIPISHSIQKERNGKEGQITGLRSVVFTGEKMGADVLGSNGKLSLSEAPVTTTNKRASSPTVKKASIIPRSEPYNT